MTATFQSVYIYKGVLFDLRLTGQKFPRQVLGERK